MSTQGWKPGRWKAVCDRCGFRFHSDQLKLEWDGLRVCQPCWEPRHPQDFLKVFPDTIAPPWVRPEPQDSFLYICSLWGASGYADLAEADCARADNTTFSYSDLVIFKNEQLYNYLLLGDGLLQLGDGQLGNT